MSFRVTVKFNAWVNIRPVLILFLRYIWVRWRALFRVEARLSFVVRDRVMVKFKFRSWAKVWCGLRFGVG